MSEQARDRIFSRLNAANRQPLTNGPQAADMPVKTFSHQEKIETLKKLMEAIRTADRNREIPADALPGNRRRLAGTNSLRPGNRTSEEDGL